MTDEERTLWADHDANPHHGTRAELAEMPSGRLMLSSADTHPGGDAVSVCLSPRQARALGIALVAWSTEQGDEPDREPTPEQERAWDEREDEARGRVLR